MSSSSFQFCSKFEEILVAAIRVDGLQWFKSAEDLGHSRDCAYALQPFDGIFSDTSGGAAMEKRFVRPRCWFARGARWRPHSELAKSVQRLVVWDVGGSRAA